MEPTLEQSLVRIFGGRFQTPAAATPAAPGPAREGMTGGRALAHRAWEIWQRSQEALRRGDWTQYGAEQKRLEETLRSLTESP